jgi:hypothetical protein
LVLSGGRAQQPRHAYNDREHGVLRAAITRELDRLMSAAYEPGACPSET